MTAALVKFPDIDISDIPKMLRSLADDIEAGRYDDAHNLAWALDCGDGRVAIGLLGRAASAGAEAHLLFAIAQRRLEGLE